MTGMDVGRLSEIQVRYPLITETALSPDGCLVVYGVREPLMTDDESRYLTHLYLAPVEGGAPVQLTWGRFTNHTARWSPDGRYLAFISDRPGLGGEKKAIIYVMRIAGGEPWALTATTQTDVVDVAWSPDGERLAFLMDDPPTEEKRVARKAKDDAVLWDEDFAFRHLYTVPFVVSPRELPEATKVTMGRIQVVKVAWMPDGATFAVTTQPTPSADDWTGSRLMTVPADVADDGRPYDAGDLQEIAVVADHNPEPIPSPDGTWIACVVSDQPVHWGASGRIVLFPAGDDGREPQALAVTPDAQCTPIGWSTAGDRVYAIEGSGLDSHVFALPVSGAEPIPVVTTATHKFAFGRVVQDRVAFAEETFTQSNSLAVWSALTGDVRPVVSPAMPDEWPPAQLPEVEVLRWEGPGGLEIEGFVTTPPGCEPGTRCPLVVHVHGGPAGAFSRGYLGRPDRYCDSLALAAQGMAILCVNPRGSSNYGKAFRFANYGDWGGGDFGDIMAGVDLLIDRGLADPDRLGIIGWSYGGYMASWAVTHTDRFKAACVGAGVTNLVSFTGTADIAGFLPDYFDAELWDDPETYMNHSAMFSAQDVTAPTLIQHGDADVRVPLGQGRELYNALKRQGVPVKMVIYPRQGHGIGELRQRFDVRKRPVAWFSRWLLGEE
ncbi:MAG: S9 family peptidase [Anaerolineae bacterium]|nr:S9 family peptidase [Anaerolineae bacterium]